MGGKRIAYRILVGKPGKETPGKNETYVGVRYKMDFGEVVYDDVDWIDVAHDRDQWRDVVNTVINLRVP
jgi:hypothetical protein